VREGPRTPNRLFDEIHRERVGHARGTCLPLPARRKSSIDRRPRRVARHLLRRAWRPALRVRWRALLENGILKRGTRLDASLPCAPGRGPLHQHNRTRRRLPYQRDRGAADPHIAPAFLSGDRHGNEERVEPWIVEPLAEILAGCQDKTFLALLKGRARNVPSRGAPPAQTLKPIDGGTHRRLGVRIRRQHRRRPLCGPGFGSMQRRCVPSGCGVRRRSCRSRSGRPKGKS
jgi:hypothetical protein